jgi:hypothetical protein
MSGLMCGLALVAGLFFVFFILIWLCLEDNDVEDGKV